MTDAGASTGGFIAGKGQTNGNAAGETFTSGSKSRVHKLCSHGRTDSRMELQLTI